MITAPDSDRATSLGRRLVDGCPVRSRSPGSRTPGPTGGAVPVLAIWKPERLEGGGRVGGLVVRPGAVDHRDGDRAGAGRAPPVIVLVSLVTPRNWSMTAGPAGGRELDVAVVAALVVVVAEVVDQHRQGQLRGTG